MIRVRDAQNSAVVSALCIKDPREEPLAPVRRCLGWPGDDPPDILDQASNTRTNGVHASMDRCGLLGDRVSGGDPEAKQIATRDRKSTRLNSSHRCISYAVFCLKKK